MKFTKLNFLLFIVSLLLMFACSSPTATCNDGIHNQGETNIDCGGPCPSCGTCSDGILNQNETAIDCGGVCSVCQTCSDGIQNQGETGIDCGGPCQMCPIIYPRTGFFGMSIIRKDTIQTSIQTGYFSMSAQLPDNAKLKIKISHISGSVWQFVLGSPSGWSVGGYDVTSQSQTFNAIGKISCDIQLYISGSGSAKIEVFENNVSTATRSNILSWQ